MHQKEKLTAIVFGSSGLTGKFVTEHLLKDARYDRLILFVRKETKVFHGKIRQIVFDPSNIDDISNDCLGDQVFCCLGTTIRKAGSREAFYKVDHDLVIETARISAKNKIPVFTVISSIGANPNSNNFYLKTKGVMEDNLKLAGISQLNILRPSLLLGLRPESRTLEDFSKFVLTRAQFLFFGKFRKYRPIHAETVARAMIRAANKPGELRILESDMIEDYGSNMNDEQ